MAAKKLKGVFHNLFHIVSENHMTDEGSASAFRMTEECAIALEEGKAVLKELADKLRGIAPGWIRNQLEKAGEVLTIFTGSSKRYILHLEQDKGNAATVCDKQENPGYSLWHAVEPGLSGYPNKRHFKGRKWLFPHQAGKRAGKGNPGDGICGGIPICL